MLHKPVQWFWMLISIAMMGVLVYGISINAHHMVMVQWADNVWPSVILAVPLAAAAVMGFLAAWAWMQATVVGEQHEGKQANKQAQKSKLAQEDVQRQLTQANQTIATLETALNKALASSAAPSSSAAASPESAATASSVPPATEL